MAHLAFEMPSMAAGSEAVAETRLWQAVIVSTIREWLSGPLRLKRDAEEYLFDERSEFAAVCQSAGMDMVRLRAELHRLKRAGVCDGAVSG